MNRNTNNSNKIGGGANGVGSNNSAIRTLEVTHKPLVILRCKVILIGDACVGKSALVQVFESGGANYPKNYLMTVGCEFVVKQVPIPNTNYVVELFLYDCGGQSIFNQLDMNAKYVSSPLPAFSASLTVASRVKYEDAAAVMVVYSISSRDSLQSSAKWMTSAKGAISSANAPICVLVGNKTDLRDGTIDSRAEITFTEGKQFAQGIGCQHFETSAATNQGVDDPFKHIAQEFFKRFEDSATSFEDFPSRRY